MRAPAPQAGTSRPGAPFIGARRPHAQERIAVPTGDAEPKRRMSGWTLLRCYQNRPEKTFCLTFKFCPTKIVHLDCDKIHQIKSNIKYQKRIVLERT